MTTIAVRIENEMDKFIVKLINLYNYKEGKSWTKSDMIRHLLEKGLVLVATEFRTKYDETIVVPKGARAFVLRKETWKEGRNNQKRNTKTDPNRR